MWKCQQTASCRNICKCQQNMAGIFFVSPACVFVFVCVCVIQGHSGDSEGLQHSGSVEERRAGGHGTCRLSR